ncbi:MAG: hypothetical protein ACOX6T_24975 [Myxococcales bacterium]
MRTYLMVLALVLAGSSAWAAQKRPSSPLPAYQGDGLKKMSPEQARRRAAGIHDVKVYGEAEKPKEKPTPWKAIGLAAGLVALTVPVALRMYRSTRKDLEDQATFGLKGSREGAADKPKKHMPSRRQSQPASAGALPEASAQDGRDAVWGALSSANDWVGADWIASSAGLTQSVASKELAALVEEGYVEEARDRAGKPVFRIAASS